MASVHRSFDCTGERSTVNIVSTALLLKVMEEVAPGSVPPKGKPHCGDGSVLFGYPVMVVDSPHIFAIAIDQEK